MHAHLPPWSISSFLLTLGLACTVPPAAAQGRIDQKLMQRYGGVLAADCANYQAPMLKFLGDELVVQERGKALLSGRNVRAKPDYFGASPPPPGFDTAVTSQIPGGEALVFVFYRNATGLYAAVEGGPKVMASLRPSLKGQRVWHCDPNRSAAPGAPPPAGPVGPAELLKDARFRNTYRKALGPLSRERWLARLDGPAPPIKDVKVQGADYQLLNVCKPHDCAEHNAVLLYAPGMVAGKVVQQGRSTLLGTPQPPMAAELERLWQAEWRGK